MIKPESFHNSVAMLVQSYGEALGAMESQRKMVLIENENLNKQILEQQRKIKALEQSIAAAAYERNEKAIPER